MGMDECTVIIGELVGGYPIVIVKLVNMGSAG